MDIRFTNAGPLIKWNLFRAAIRFIKNKQWTRRVVSIEFINSNHENLSV